MRFGKPGRHIDNVCRSSCSLCGSVAELPGSRRVRCSWTVRVMVLNRCVEVQTSRAEVRRLSVSRDTWTLWVQCSCAAARVARRVR